MYLHGYTVWYFQVTRRFTDYVFRSVGFRCKPKASGILQAYSISKFDVRVFTGVIVVVMLVSGGDDEWWFQCQVVCVYGVYVTCEYHVCVSVFDVCVCDVCVCVTCVCVCDRVYVCQGVWRVAVPCVCMCV